MMRPTILAAVLFSAASAHAQERTLPLWEAGIGAAFFSTPAYPGADDRSNRGLALPYLLYRGKILRADQNGVGARLLNTDKVEFDIGFSGALPAHSDDVDARRGMPDLGTLVEFGPRVKYKFADLGEHGRLRAELPLRAVIEARGGLRAVFGDRRVNRYFYEVAPQYATAERPAYQADGGLLLVRTGVSGTWRLNPDLRLFGFVRLESYSGAANEDSPLMRKSTAASVGMGFAWTFARSTRAAYSNE
jgi:outer membrane protein